MDSLVFLLSVVSLITTIIGLIYLGEKNKSGFITFSMSLFCQMILFYLQKNWFLVFQMIVLIFFNIKNYIKWRKDEQK